MAVDKASALLVAALDGEEVSAAERSFFEKECPAGVTLFRRNISPSFLAVQKLCKEIQSFSQLDCPSLICIDQEGGRVSRLPEPFPNRGPALNLAEGLKSEDVLNYIQNYGWTVGASLKALGINVNFAPVLDVLSNEQNIAIGDRCFARNAEAVASRAGAYLNGLQESGVQACLKHFPGQGDASDDTHESGTCIRASEELMLERELIPYVSLAKRCDMVMISHAVFSAYDTKPASLSKVIMQDLLRDQIGFGGVIVSDDMNMKAMPQDEKSWQDVMVDAVANGADLLLVCKGLDRCKLALEALRSEAQRSPAFDSRLDEAAKRVRALRLKLS